MFHLRSNHLLCALFALTVTLAPASAASDWVEDDDLSDFYSHGVQGSNSQPSQVPRSFDDDSINQGMIPNDIGGSGGSGSYNQQPFVPSQGAAVPPPQEKSGSFLGKLGKSIINIPKGFADDTGDVLGSPDFWQGAGALAGTGANLYMANRYMRNNPGYWNNPINPYYPYGGGAGYNPYYNNPYVYNGTLPGQINGQVPNYNPASPWNSPYMNPYNGFNNGFNSPYGQYGGSFNNSPFQFGFGPSPYQNNGMFRPFGSAVPK